MVRVPRTKAENFLWLLSFFQEKESDKASEKQLSF
jgi:hypothetical protein